MEKYFLCENCKQKVKTEGCIGTKNRNHCPNCLYSKHIDEIKPGDRGSNCKGIMEPVDIAFKKNKKNKYGKGQKGELMIVHRCKKCGLIVKNRIAGDDNDDKLLKLCKNIEDKEEVRTQIYGKTRNEV